MSTTTPERRTSRMTLDQQSHYAAAADFALRRYPGPLGELIHRELVAYAEFGHRFAADALIPRLAVHVLRPPDPAPDRDTGPASTPTHPTRTPPAPRGRRAGNPSPGADASPQGSTTLPPGFALWPKPARERRTVET